MHFRQETSLTLAERDPLLPLEKALSLAERERKNTRKIMEK